VQPRLKRLLIGMSWNSRRREGNTYCLLDTSALIEGEAAEGEAARDVQMILNHKAAIVSILNPYALLAENLLPDEGTGCGPLCPHAGEKGIVTPAIDWSY
jgi:hypothetical protein